MALFETCSDDGKRSALLTEKLVCGICGKIKPCYNVEDKTSGTAETNTPGHSEKKEEIYVCQCSQETCFQWLKRIVGLGSGKRERDLCFQSKREITGDVSIKLQRDTSSGSKYDGREYHSKLSVLIAEVNTDIERTTSSRNDQGLLDSDESYVIFKEPRVKIKNKKKSQEVGRPDLFSLDESADPRAHLRQRKKEKVRIFASTATVFQTYRSRALYTLQPAQLRMSIEDKKLAKKAQRQKRLAYQKIKEGGSPNDSSALSEAHADRNQSATHVEGYSFKDTSDLKKYFHIHAIRPSRSGPQTQRDYQELIACSTMTYISYSCMPIEGHYPLNRTSRFSACQIRSCSEPCRPRNFNTERMKVPQSGASCFPLPYPMVLSCVSPSVQKTSQVQKRKHSTPKMGLNKGSCSNFLPFQRGGHDNTMLSLVHSHLKGSGFSTKWAGNEALEPGANICQRIGRHRSKLGQNPARFQTKAMVRSGSSPPLSRFWRQRESFTPKSMYWQMPLTQNRRGHSKQRKETAKMWATIQHFNTKHRSPRSCPPDCIGTSVSFSPPSYKPKPVMFKKTQLTPPNFRSISSASAFNFSQSSNNGIHQESKQCSKCHTPIGFSQTPSSKVCKCNIVLAPTCVRRGGPRSTVREYLSTIDHPKPRFKPPVFTSRAHKQAGSQQAVNDAPEVEKKKKKLKAKSAVDAEPKEDEEAKAAAEEDGVKSGPATAGASTAALQKKDDNNNYGPNVSVSPTRTKNTDRSVHTTSGRVGSLPSYFYTSYLDSGYARVNPSPYSTSYELQASQGNNPYAPSEDFGYLRAAHEFRKAIRENYKQRRFLGDAGLKAWRTSTQDEHISQFQAWSPTVHVNTQMQSSEESRRKKSEVHQTKSLDHRKIAEPKLKTMSLDKKRADARPISLPQSPQPKESLPQFFPKKSFLEGKAPKYLNSPEIKKNENVFNENASKAQFVKTPKIEAKKITESKIDATEHKAELENVSHGVSDAAPCEEEKSESSNTCEKQDTDKKRDCGDVENIEPSKPIDNSDVLEQHKQDDSRQEKGLDELKQIRVAAILDGKESSVDYEKTANDCRPLPSTVRKIEPRGDIIKPILNEPSPISLSTQEMKESIPCIDPAPTSPPPQPPTTPSHGEQNSNQTPAKQTPVFQNLMERFSGNIQIYVRTKKTTEDKPAKNEIVPGSAGDADRKESPDAILESSNQQTGETTAAGRVLEKTSKGSECIAAWSQDNQTKNKATPSCGVTSQYGSWSEVDGVKQTAPSQPAIIEQSSATLTQVQSVSSLKAASGDPYTIPRAKSIAMEVEICTTTERVYLEKTSGMKPANNSLAISNEAIIGSAALEQGTPTDPSSFTKTLSKGTYVIKPNSKVCFGAGETGRVDETTGGQAKLSCPRKSRYEVKSVGASIEALPGDIPQPSSLADKLQLGSSVDPTPDSNGDKINQDILEAISGTQSMFQKVGTDGCDGAIIMSAKSKFLENLKLRGKSMTNLPVTVTPAAVHSGPLAAVVCKSLVNTCTPLLGPVRPGDPVRLGALTEAMKTFISLHGTPV